ncbi:hypothetical protein [Agromyces allii]|uniref:DUF4064 domain-containing protein n=1 Tax=Agromyces allii TaxID=393607 RepID=A0ABP5C4T9_9MICO|nr:hypothetical protein [Agromyces allii]
MSSKAQQKQHEEAINVTDGKSGLWGFLAGLIVAAFIAIPLSAAFSFATHPNTQQLFSGRLDEASQGGYTAFWWLATIFLAALPFLVGYAVANLTRKSLAIVGAIIALFIIAALVLGQLFLVV